MTALRALMVRKGWNVAELARRSTVSERAIYSALRGNDCRNTTKRLLLRSFGIPYSRHGEFFPMTVPLSRVRKLQTDALAILRRAHQEPERWTLQGFGMLRYYPERSQGARLHVWDPSLATPNVSEKHTHPWHFVSTVLSGAVANHVYVSPPGVVEAFPHMRQRILCGEGGGLCGEPEECLIGLDHTNLRTTGQSYRMEAEQVHLSEPDPGTVTWCDRDLSGADLDHAYVFWPDGQEWVSAEPRPAETEELRQAIGLALEKWETV